MRIGRSKSSFFPSSSSQTLTPSEHHQISRSCTRNLGTCIVASIFCFSMFHESCFFIQKSTQNKISCASVPFSGKVPPRLVLDYRFFDGVFQLRTGLVCFVILRYEGSSSFRNLDSSFVRMTGTFLLSARGCWPLDRCCMRL